MGDFVGHPFRGNQWSKSGWSDEDGATRVDLRFRADGAETSAQAERKVRAAMPKLFGHNRVEELADAIGAPDGSVVTAILGDDGKISVTADLPGHIGRISRSFMTVLDTHDRRTGQPLDEPVRMKIALNHAFFLSPDVQGQGIGTKVLLEQAEYLSKHGFDHIETDAVGSAEMRREYGDAAPEVGYYTWARMGYQATIKGPMGVKMQLTDLMKTPEGRSWWKENGHSFTGKFSLKSDSVSMRVLRAYAKEKGVK